MDEREGRFTRLQHTDTQLTQYGYLTGFNFFYRVGNDRVLKDTSPYVEK
jgi:hypothetical protein